MDAVGSQDSAFPGGGNVKSRAGQVLGPDLGVKYPGVFTW